MTVLQQSNSDDSHRNAGETASGSGRRDQDPAVSLKARIEAGQLQQGENIGMPHSRPMPTIGGGCHELRISDAQHNWRVFYHLAKRHIVILEVFDKKTQETPDEVITRCQNRLASYQAAMQAAIAAEDEKGKKK